MLSQRYIITENHKCKINAITRSQVNKDQTTIIGHLTTSTGTIKQKEGKEPEEEEEIEEMGETAPVVVRHRTLMHLFVNPCYYLEQLLKPFLKCLGLESTYQDS